MVEQILEDYHTAYGLSAVVFRYFNAAGAATDGSIGEVHHPESHLIPILLDKLTNGGEFTVNGNDYDTPDKTAIRDFVHVMDIAQAHVLGLEHAHFEKPFDIFNIGSGEGFSIKQVIEQAEKITGKQLNVIFGPRRAGDPSRLVADSSKLREKLGWKPEYSSLDTILQTALHWYKKNQK
jgi:UDP-glucose 4-epimerase